MLAALQRTGDVTLTPEPVTSPALPTAPAPITRGTIAPTLEPLAPSMTEKTTVASITRDVSIATIAPPTIYTELPVRPGDVYDLPVIPPPAPPPPSLPGLYVQPRVPDTIVEQPVVASPGPYIQPRAPEPFPEVYTPPPVPFGFQPPEQPAVVAEPEPPAIIPNLPPTPIPAEITTSVLPAPGGTTPQVMEEQQGLYSTLPSAQGGPSAPTSPTSSVVQQVQQTAERWISRVQSFLGDLANAKQEASTLPQQIKEGREDLRKAATLQAMLPLAVFGIGILVKKPLVGAAIGAVLYFTSKEQSS